MDVEEQGRAETAEFGSSGEYDIHRPAPNRQLLPSQIQGQGQQEQHLARANLWKPYYEDPNIDES